MLPMGLLCIPQVRPLDCAGIRGMVCASIPEVVDGLHCAFYLACLQVYSVLQAQHRPSALRLQA